MTIYSLIDEIIFPDVNNAEDDGLLAVGGDLSPERVLFALSIGIFPWFDDDEQILWWAPDPRYVIFVKNAKLSKSLRKAYSGFTYKINSDFKSVISACANKERPGQDGTWISESIKQTYTTLNETNITYAYSFETYLDKKLVGGLYGVLLGKIFIGESMFSDVSNASKAAFMHLIAFCEVNKIEIVDCQFHTPHLESLGGEFISRLEYSEYLSKFVELPLIEK